MERLETAGPSAIRQMSSRIIIVILLGILAAFVILSIILGTLVGVIHVQSSGRSTKANSATGVAKLTGGGKAWPDPGLCLDKGECLHTAAWMSQNMDQSINPCDNFYKYSCGGWEANRTIPADWRSFTIEDKLWLDFDKKIKNILGSRVKDRRDGSAERKLKDFYRSCLHDYGRMKDGGKTIIDIIKNKFGGWYAIDPNNWQSDRWDANGALTSAISEYLIDVLFRVDVYPYNDRGMITIAYGGIGMYASTFHDNDKTHLQSAYKDYIRDVGRLLLRDANVSVNNEALEQFVQDAYYQESHIASHMLRIQKAGNFYHSPVSTIGQLSTNFTQINWLSIIRGYFGPSVNSDTQVYVRTQAYFSMIDQLLRNESENKNRILNNYLIWSFADTYGYYLSMEYKFAAYKFWQAYWGQVEGGSTQESCIAIIEFRLGLALASEYFNNHVDRNAVSKARDLFEGLKQTYKNTVDDVFWMDNVTQSRVKDKLTNMDVMIGFPPRFFDKTFIDEIHIDLVVNRSQGFFTNVMNTNQYLKKSLQMELQSGPDYYKWHFVLHESAFGLRPTYFWASNHISIPAGAVQFPQFVANQPAFANFGGLGARVATSIYEDMVSTAWYSEDASLQWTDDTHENNQKMEECLQNYTKKMQSRAFDIDGEKVTAVISPYSVFSVIPDMIGAKVAYDSYMSRLRQSGPEQYPPGVGLNDIQALFVSMAQDRCAKRRDVDAYNKIRGGSLTEELQVNLMVSHMEEFSTAFQCKTGSKMNPVEKCRVW